MGTELGVELGMGSTHFGHGPATVSMYNMVDVLMIFLPSSQHDRLFATFILQRNSITIYWGNYRKTTALQALGSRCWNNTTAAPTEGASSPLT